MEWVLPWVSSSFDVDTALEAVVVVCLRPRWRDRREQSAPPSSIDVSAVLFSAIRPVISSKLVSTLRIAGRGVGSEADCGATDSVSRIGVPVYGKEERCLPVCPLSVERGLESFIFRHQ
jgi:hypothetical protein